MGRNGDMQPLLGDSSKDRGSENSENQTDPLPDDRLDLLAGVLLRHGKEVRLRQILGRWVCANPHSLIEYSPESMLTARMKPWPAPW
jgi:hypothetical protein